MKPEVSAKVLGIFFQQLARKGLPAEELAAGTGWPVARLQTTGEWMDWATFAVFMGNVGRVFTPEEIVSIGGDFLRSVPMRHVGVIARAMFTAPEFFRWLFDGKDGSGSQGFRCLRATFEVQDPQRLRLTLELPEGYPRPPEFFLTCKGNFAEMPRLLGLPPAGVELELTPRGAVFLVALPLEGGLFGRVKRLITRPFAARAAGEELKNAHRALLIKFQELEGARAELAAHAARLERTVAERTEQLRESLVKVTEADRQKSEFFATASHELRTPLTLMLAPLESLLELPALPGEIRSELTRVLRSGYRLLKVINDVLDLARVESGRLRLRREPTDLRRIVEECCRAWRSEEAGRQVTLALEAPAPLPLVADPARLEQVVLNLISNAVKNSPDGAQVRLTARAASGGVELLVDREGAGLDAEDLPRFFDRFTQANGPGSRRYLSSGLGLALVREFIELHEGHAEVKSGPGERVIARVWLPLGPSTLLEAPAEVPRPDRAAMLQYELSSALDSAAAPAPEESSDDKPLLLIAEDSADMRHSLARCLRNDFQILEAVDGAQALQLARERLPDLVLSDIMMPELDGLELCQALKADPSTMTTPVVLLTARVDLEDRLAGFEGGADDYVVKPFHPAELRARLHSQLRLRRLSERVAHSEKLAALGTLVAGVAHEVRNPLNGLINSLGPLKQSLSGASPEVSELLDLAIESSKRVDHISGQLLRQAQVGDHTRVSVDL
ncbi:MAG: ATP-binding response regulator, partial [Myxococcaceae bacterium]